MVETIANILAQDFINVSFVSKAAGVMQILKKPLPDKQEIHIPVARIIYTKEETQYCNTMRPYFELLPNENESCIIYFEDLGAKLKERNKRYSTYEGGLRLVGWLNMKKIGLESAPETLKEAIRSHLRRSIGSTGLLHAVKIKIDQIAPNRPDPFEKFKLNEALKQFIVYPYDYFSFTIKYICLASNNCALEIVPIEIPCGPGIGAMVIGNTFIVS